MILSLGNYMLACCKGNNVFKRHEIEWSSFESVADRWRVVERVIETERIVCCSNENDVLGRGLYISVSHLDVRQSIRSSSRVQPQRIDSVER